MRNTAAHKQGHRVAWIDIAKGIAIVLMYLGHAPAIPRSVYEIIFTFHMPLFFVLTGYTFSIKNDQTLASGFHKGFRRLLVPYFIVAVIEISIRLAGLISGQMSREMLSGKIFGALYGNCARLDILGYRISGMGPIWFLVALFWSRLLFQGLLAHTNHSQSMRLLLVVLVSFAGYFIGQDLFLPMNLDIAAASLGFLYAGFLAKETSLFIDDRNTIDRNQHRSRRRIAVLVACALLWAFSALGLELRLNIAGRSYPEYPLIYLTAIAGSFLVMQCSHWIHETRRIGRLLEFIGIHSLAFLCIHTLVMQIQPLTRLTTQLGSSGAEILFGDEMKFGLNLFLALVVCAVWLVISFVLVQIYSRASDREHGLTPSQRISESDLCRDRSHTTHRPD